MHSHSVNMHGPLYRGVRGLNWFEPLYAPTLCVPVGKALEKLLVCAGLYCLCDKQGNRLTIST